MSYFLNTGFSAFLYGIVHPPIEYFEAFKCLDDLETDDEVDRFMKACNRGSIPLHYEHLYVKGREYQIGTVISSNLLQDGSIGILVEINYRWAIEEVRSGRLRGFSWLGYGEKGVTKRTGLVGMRSLAIGEISLVSRPARCQSRYLVYITDNYIGSYSTAIQQRPMEDQLRPSQKEFLEKYKQGQVSSAEVQQMLLTNFIRSNLSQKQFEEKTKELRGIVTNKDGYYHAMVTSGIAPEVAAEEVDSFATYLQEDPAFARRVENFVRVSSSRVGKNGVDIMTHNKMREEFEAERTKAMKLSEEYEDIKTRLRQYEEKEKAKQAESDGRIEKHETEKIFTSVASSQSPPPLSAVSNKKPEPLYFTEDILMSKWHSPLVAKNSPVPPPQEPKR